MLDMAAPADTRTLEKMLAAAELKLLFSRRAVTLGGCGGGGGAGSTQKLLRSPTLGSGMVVFCGGGTGGGFKGAFNVVSEEAMPANFPVLSEEVLVVIASSPNDPEPTAPFLLGRWDCDISTSSQS